jgi:phage terminase small subunit
VMSGLPVRLEKAESSMRLLGSDLGMNPASRTRLSVSEAKAVDPFEEFLNGRSSTG